MKTFEIVTKKNKRKNLLKTSLIATGVTLTSLVLAHMGLERLTSHNAWEIQRYREHMVTISMPNISNRTAYFTPTSAYTGLVHIDQIKDIAGIPVHYDTLELPYNLRPGIGHPTGGTYGDEAGTASYTYTSGKKVPHFFNPAYNYTDTSYTKLTQDIAQLPQMSGQAVEMAVTFDKPYTFEEIAELIPDTLKVNWYWIGTSGDYDTVSVRQEDLFGFEGDTDTPLSYQQQQEDEQNTKGMSMEEIEAYYKDRIGQKPASVEEGFANSYSFFVGGLQKALDKGWLGSSYGSADDKVLDTKDDVTAFLKANPDAKTAKFSGVILTGRAEDFAPLDKQPWIFGSNIGEHVTIQPYHTLDVE